MMNIRPTSGNNSYLRLPQSKVQFKQSENYSFKEVKVDSLILTGKNEKLEEKKDSESDCANGPLKWIVKGVKHLYKLVKSQVEKDIGRYIVEGTIYSGIDHALEEMTKEKTQEEQETKEP